MKLTIEPITEALDFREEAVWSLCVQSSGAYRQMIESLHDHYYRRDDGTNVRLQDDNGDLIDITKGVLIIHDSYTFDISSRPIITALVKDLQERTVLDDISLQKIENDILDLVGELDLQSHHKLTYKSEVGLSDILKMMEIKLAASEQYGLIDKMYSIVEIAGSLLAKHLVIFINQRCLVSSDEFVGLMEFARCQQQSVLFIDPIDVVVANGERRVMVDEDLYCYAQ
jgi:CRISPR type II-A-associated protein Csn2